MKSNQQGLSGLFVFVGTLGSGCSSGLPADKPDAGVGAATATGGAAGSTAHTGGAAGSSVLTGGTAAVGGSSAASGGQGGATSSSAVSSTGGASIVGGSVSVGGATSAGGTSIAGGTTNGTGGSNSTSSSISTGGSISSGGSNSSGGSVSIGGSANTGGAATGGSSATGGAATGGVATGGAATGGAATGGVATGGAATGGAATGGAATGGAATGGAATGGVATGGAATGGAGTGGSATGGVTATSGYNIPGQSCARMTAIECNGEDCCTSLPVPTGTFPMGRGSETCSNCSAGCPGDMSCDLDETPEHDVTVNAFLLDKYEVTVGRFRTFVSAYGKINAPPPVFSGGYPSMNNSGWQEAWNTNLPGDVTQLRNELKCDATYQTWTDDPGANELLAINCISWFLAYAFCIWDGGRLATESEWEYAAAGGIENRLFPWGSSPAPSCNLANYPGCTGKVAQVGSLPDGKGRWEHMDLAGNVWEWTMDWYDQNSYSSISSACSGCPNLETNLTTRVNRGAAFSYGNTRDWLRAASRYANSPTLRNLSTGIRCARNN